MEEFKKYIIELIYDAIGKISNEEILKQEEIQDILEIPKEKTNGDFAFPCFKLSKYLKDSPVNIANNIQGIITENIDNSLIEKVEVISGFLNFYLAKKNISENVLKKILVEKEKYGSSDEGKGKTIVIDYSSPNIAKPFHLGHFRNTVLGQAIYNLYKFKGYNLVGINYLGDWGRQFGLVIEGYKRFKDEYDIKNYPLKSFSEIYVRISILAKENEDIMNSARENFRELENGNEEYTKLWEYIRSTSLKEYNRLYDTLKVKFDSYNGEAFYNDKMDEVIEILDKKGVLEDSQGAKVVYIDDKTPPCIILKSNGSTIYATRDLAAILYRAREYDFTKAIYVTAYEQDLHFKQVFKVAENIVDEKYTKGLVHISYGMVRLKSGKMSTRDGNVIVVDELLTDAISRATKIMEEKNKDIDNFEYIVKKVGIGALIFNNLKQSKSKDIIFDLDEILRFDGETGPYLQYTYVRTKSIIEKSGIDIENLNIEDLKYELLDTKIEQELIKELANFEDVLNKAKDNYEPAILARYLIDIATIFSKLYSEVSILNADNKDTVLVRLALVYSTSIVIKNGLKLLGIDTPNKM